jgi:hypothetical protein
MKSNVICRNELNKDLNLEDLNAVLHECISRISQIDGTASRETIENEALLAKTIIEYARTIIACGELALNAIKTVDGAISEIKLPKMLRGTT